MQIYIILIVFLITIIVSIGIINTESKIVISKIKNKLKMDVYVKGWHQVSKYVTPKDLAFNFDKINNLQNRSKK